MTILPLVASSLASANLARPARYAAAMPDADLELAWAAVHDATPEDRYVGRPYLDERHNRWE